MLGLSQLSQPCLYFLLMSSYLDYTIHSGTRHWIQTHTVLNLSQVPLPVEVDEQNKISSPIKQDALFIHLQ